MAGKFLRLSFQYVPKKEDAGAALNFHLSKREKQDIAEALDSDKNRAMFTRFRSLATHTDSALVAKQDE